MWVDFYLVCLIEPLLLMSQQASAASEVRITGFLARNLETPGSCPNLEQTTRAPSFHPENT